MQKNKQVVFLGILLGCVIADQLTKFVANKFINISEKISLIPDVLSFEKVYNTGAAFSILQDNIILLCLISITTLLLIFSFIFKPTTKLNLGEIIGLSFISGGAIGNLIDRLFLGYVIDFIQFDFITFPIFNFADIFINIGVIILLISNLFFKNDK